MLNRIRIAIKQKGQGIIEYAVLLAFIVGLAVMLQSGGLKDSVKSVFDDVAYVLGGGDWGHMDLGKFNDSNKAKRLAQDQQALVNLANYFIGKTKTEVKDMLKGDTNHKEGYSGDMAWNGGKGDDDFALGYFVKNDDGGTVFVTSALNADQSENILKWMQGDYNNNNSYDSTNKYLVSDYVLANGWTGDYAANQNKLTVRFQYDNNSKNADRRVVAAKISIDPGNQSNGSSGLEVQVKDGKVTYNDTGLSNSVEGWNVYAPISQ